MSGSRIGSILIYTYIICSIPISIEQWLIIVRTSILRLSHHDINIRPRCPIIKQLLVLSEVKYRSVAVMVKRTHSYYDDRKENGNAQRAEGDVVLLISLQVSSTATPG